MSPTAREPDGVNSKVSSDVAPTTELNAETETFESVTI